MHKKIYNLATKLFISVCAVAVVAAIIFAVVINGVPEIVEEKIPLTPKEVMQKYADYVNEGKYEEMYALLSEQSQSDISKEDFVTKNKNIYEGMEAENIVTNITEVTEMEEQTTISFDSRMDTIAGEISFSNKAYLKLNSEKEYCVIWSSQLIFPNLGIDDKVRVNTLRPERGSILDRNGEILAGKGVASSVGFVPGKMSENRQKDVERAAELLGVSVENINNRLKAPYVKDDTLVPIRIIPKGVEEFEESLLQISGIKITDVAVREYPFGGKTSHLIGYIQKVTAEDLEELKGQGYNADSVIGKNGLEKILEDRLRGMNGYEIIILNKDGQIKQELAKKHPRNGETIKLTIDAWVQSSLYDRFCDDKSASVAMNPKTGEILALVSTPSFDANDFVFGLSVAKWEAMNNDENKPLYNRFKAALCPGSGFKPIIGAIGLTTGIINSNDNYGNSGRSWQKDASWGGYKVTTLKDYGNQVVLRNALIYSDNIYFAKAALNIGKETLAEQLLKIGFDGDIPFEIGLYWSSFSNTNSFESEIQLADSGYGQAQVLINPIHMAAVYSAFLNDGSMIKPRLIYGDNSQPEFWKENVFSKEAADIIREDLVQVVEQGAGGLAKIEGMAIAGKTGTAEIKLSKDDVDGTELGWFNVFTADENAEKPLLIITMVEDVKNRGGSSYVIPKIRTIFEYR